MSRPSSDGGKICAGRSGVTLDTFRDRSHPDTLGQCLEDERVCAPEQFGELFPGVAERLDGEIGEIEDGCRPMITTVRGADYWSGRPPLFREQRALISRLLHGFNDRLKYYHDKV